MTNIHTHTQTHYVGHRSARETTNRAPSHFRLIISIFLYGVRKVGDVSGKRAVCVCAPSGNWGNDGNWEQMKGIILAEKKSNSNWKMNIRPIPCIESRWLPIRIYTGTQCRNGREKKAPKESNIFNAHLFFRKDFLGCSGQITRSVRLLMKNMV